MNFDRFFFSFFKKSACKQTKSDYACIPEIYRLVFFTFSHNSLLTHTSLVGTECGIAMLDYMVGENMGDEDEKIEREHTSLE